MYLSTARAGDRRDGQSAAAPHDGVRRRVPATVLALGTVSLLTDVSSEMVSASMGLYLMYGLGVGYLALGLVDALQTGATAVLRMAGGWTADRLGRPKAVATVGYGLSAACKLALPAVGGSLGGLSAVVTADRAGKGVRTAPRDAMITAASHPADLGRSFGVHRAMDTCGALLGPLVAFGLLAAVPGGYDVVFVTSFCLAAAGVVVLVLFVRDRAPRSAGSRPSLRVGLRAAASPALRGPLLATGVLGVATAGDLFFFLALQRLAGLPSHVLPLLPLLSALAFLGAALPLGRLADAWGRWPTFVGGHVVLLLAYVTLLCGTGGWLTAVPVLALHGLFYAATDGVLMAYAAAHVPDEVRATGLATVQTAQAVSRAAGAAAFGVLAAAVGIAGGLGLLTAGLAVGVVLAATRLAPRTVPGTVR